MRGRLHTRVIRMALGRRVLAGVSVAALVIAVPAVGVAKPFDHVHYEFSDSGTFDDCGFPVDFDASGRGNAMLREAPGGQAFLEHDNYDFRNVLTNPQTGAWMLVRGKGMFKDLTARHVEGDVWEFTSQDVGQPFVIEDSDGHVVLRDRGRITFRLLFDTLGDSQPGGIALEEEVTGVFGPHPGLDTDFCAVVTELIG